jgi:hypothetical protein
MIRISTLVSIMLLSCAAFPAQAQVFDDGPSAPPTISFGEKNAELKTILDLQSQMQLLKRLINQRTFYEWRSDRAQEANP